ncbi:hypothetical protein ACFX19_003069 [Malus domestica]
MKVQGTLKYSDRLALEVSTASPRKNCTPLLKLSYFQEAIETYERKYQWYMSPLRIPLSYSSLRKPGPLTRRILDTLFKRRQNKSLVYNYILEGRTQLKTLTSLSPPWHIRCTPTKSDVFSSPPPSGGALNWYCRLPPKTVDSFEELRKLFVSQHIFQTDRLHSADDLYTICQKPNKSLREYAGRFNHEYSHYAEADDKTTFKAFTAGLRDCFFKYMINANTWKTYSEVMAQTYNHASAEARTYQGKPPTTTPYQQVGSGSQIKPNEKTSTFQTAAVPPPALLNTSSSQQTYQSQGKRKDFYPHQSHFSKKSKGHYRDNQWYRHDNPQP